MSTRCQIGFYDEDEKDLNNFNALLYRHSDGYPDSEHGVIASVMPFIESFKARRGLDDMEYFSARLLQHLCNVYDNFPKSMEEEGELGYGISRVFHWDLAYFYKITPKTLEVYEANTHKMMTEGTDINTCMKLIKKYTVTF